METKLITREVHVIDTDESHLFCRASLGNSQVLSIRFSKPPTMEQVKLAVKILQFNGEGAFGKDEWKKPWPVKRSPRSPEDSPAGDAGGS